MGIKNKTIFVNLPAYIGNVWATKMIIIKLGFLVKDKKSGLYVLFNHEL